MGFSVRLVIPQNWSSSNRKVENLDLKEIVQFEADTLLSRDKAEGQDESPAILGLIVEELGKCGARFELSGFFPGGLPVTTDDLHWFLEGLPGLIRFLAQESTRNYTLQLWGQGIETEITFEKQLDPDAEIVLIANSCIGRPLTRGQESISRSDLSSQISRFVHAYEIAVSQLTPQFRGHPWNRDLEKLAAGLRPQ